MHTLFAEFGLIFIAATLCAVLARLFKQPSIVGYVLCGIIFGPLGAHFLKQQAALASLEHLGVALLLFVIGMELDWKKASSLLGTTALLGFLQITGSFAVGLLAAVFFDFNSWTGVYLGAALAFSSAVVVVKLLSESGELHALHGRLATSLLIVQDLTAAVVVIIFSGLSVQSSFSFPTLLTLLVLKSACILVLLYLAAVYLLPLLFARLARVGELLFLASIAWCFVIAIASISLGLPLEVGAFLAGISLASLPYTLDIVNRLRSLRDFFIIMLFVGLGSHLQLDASALVLTVILTIISIVLKPFLAFVILHARGFKSRTAFFTALTQGQISEFSLIVVAIGISHNLLSGVVGTSIVATAAFSILISTVLLANRVVLYNLIRPLLSHLKQQRRRPHPLDEKPLRDHIIIFGYHRMGYHILKEIKDLGRTVIVVDVNPDIIRQLNEQGIEAFYGDIQDEELLEVTQAKAASMIISTIPHREETEFLLAELKNLNSKAIAVVTSHHIDDALAYYEQGASYVILPHILGGEQVAELLASYQGKSLQHFSKAQAKEAEKLLKTKNHHLYYN